MTKPPDTVPLAEYEAVRQLHQTTVVRARNAEQRERELRELHNEDQREIERIKHERDVARHEVLATGVAVLKLAKAEERIETLSRQLHRWQTGTQIESDYIPHWVTRSEFEEVAQRRDELERMVKGLVELRDSLRKGLSEKEAELSEAQEKIGILMQPIPEVHGDFPWQMMRLWVANYAQEKQAWREADEERDRLHKLLKETNAKRATCKREIRRLQAALLRQRGQHRWVEIERLEQRVQALEGSRGGSPTAALEIFGQLQELEGRIVRNAGRVSRENRPRWSHVSDVTAHGLTLSADMCRRHGVDPDELIGGEE